MNIEEIRKEKRETEEQILKLIRDFKSKTKLQIQSISLINDKHESIGEIYFLPSVRLEVRI